jgi:hypothetical protein
MTSRALHLGLLLGFMLAGCAERKVTHATDVPALHYPESLKVVTRDRWGWEEGNRSLPPHIVTRITIHHGGEDFPVDKDPIEYLQHLQSWSRTEKNWIDIPYHFMIDLQGKIYEARPVNLPGDTNTGYDTRGHALICVMGNYENQIISAEQLSALISLTAFLAKTFDVAVDSIKGHKDYAETLCPGKDLYRYLQDGTIARGVKEILHH